MPMSDKFRYNVVQEHHVLDSGIAVTLDRPASDPYDDLVVIVPPFGRRRDQVTIIGAYLSANGVPALRVDLRNHDGESEGDIEHFRLSGVVEDLEAVTAWAREQYRPGRMAIVTSSLSTRPALRFLAISEAAAEYDCFAALVPVLDVRKVVAQAAKIDVFEAVNDQGYTGTIEVLTKHVDAVEFVHDAENAGMDGPGESHNELPQVDADVALFAGTDDEWVSNRDIQEAQQADERVKVYEVPHARHDIGRNLSVARVFLGQLTELLLGRHGVAEAAFEPSLEALIAESRNARAR